MSRFEGRRRGWITFALVVGVMAGIAFTRVDPADRPTVVRTELQSPAVAEIPTTLPPPPTSQPASPSGDVPVPVPTPPSPGPAPETNAGNIPASETIPALDPAPDVVPADPATYGPYSGSGPTTTIAEVIYCWASTPHRAPMPPSGDCGPPPTTTP